jgi:hypothetical protein
MESLESAPQSNQARADLLLKNFERLGCSDAQMLPIARSSHRNVICRLVGDTSLTIVVGAHYDKTSRGKGVADNWTGIALLPYLYAEMATHGPQYTYVFIGFAEEEAHSEGAIHYLSSLGQEQRKNMPAMINLDTLGLDLMQADPRSADFLQHKLGCAALNLGLELAPSRLYRWITGDWEPFKAAGIPVLNLHSLSRDSARLIHSTRDSILVIKKDKYLDSFRIIRQLLLELDRSMS